MFTPVGIRRDGTDKRSFLRFSFANKGLDVIHLGYVLHLILVKCTPYSKNKYLTIISYTYTTHITTKVFNHTNTNV